MDPAILWSIVKHDRLRDRRYLELAGEGFYFTNTDSLQQYLHEFDLNLGGSLGGQETIPETDKHRYLVGSIMEESIASSQIEGAVTSRVVAKDMLRKNRPPRTVSERMIVNNYLTIQHIVKTKNEPLTLDSLLALHRLMIADTMEKPEEAGQLRTNDTIYVVDAVEGDVIHTPPSYTKMGTFVTDLCRLFNDETPDFFVHPVVRASIIHFLIGYFHPFTDGNGRTARALFYWYLLRKGYWLTEYLSISRVIMQSRSQYYRAFQYTEIDENDLTYFVLYQVKTLSKAYDELKKYIARKNAEKRQLLTLQVNEGLSPRQAEIVRWLEENSHATLSAKEVQMRLAVSGQTARNDIKILIDKGYLAELFVNRKERQYIRGPRWRG
ncbi:cell filamentation protein Fic [Spirosoma montaniterrae]|uniref:Cell filamentation protein Fic n=1 Tax=Spirosoma montaniterrae TaxID=1178516 RepID=A0A1P9X4F1_9BACT|nr:cell filamentation protein Fic [Spirosoma montaniterrae]